MKIIDHDRSAPQSESSLNKERVLLLVLDCCSRSEQKSVKMSPDQDYGDSVTWKQGKRICLYISFDPLFHSPLPNNTGKHPSYATIILNNYPDCSLFLISPINQEQNLQDLDINHDGKIIPASYTVHSHRYFKQLP